MNINSISPMTFGARKPIYNGDKDLPVAREVASAQLVQAKMNYLRMRRKITRLHDSIILAVATDAKKASGFVPPDNALKQKVNRWKRMLPEWRVARDQYQKARTHLNSEWKRCRDVLGMDETTLARFVSDVRPSDVGLRSENSLMSRAMAKLRHRITGFYPDDGDSARHMKA